MFWTDELSAGSKEVIILIIESVILFCFLLTIFWLLSATTAGHNFVVSFMSWLCQRPYTEPIVLPPLNAKSILILAAASPVYVWYSHNRGII